MHRLCAALTVERKQEVKVEDTPPIKKSEGRQKNAANQTRDTIDFSTFLYFFLLLWFLNSSMKRAYQQHLLFCLLAGGEDKEN